MREEKIATITLFQDETLASFKKRYFTSFVNVRYKIKLEPIFGRYCAGSCIVNSFTAMIYANCFLAEEGQYHVRDAAKLPVATFLIQCRSCIRGRQSASVVHQQPHDVVVVDD